MKLPDYPPPSPLLPHPPKRDKNPASCSKSCMWGKSLHLLATFKYLPKICALMFVGFVFFFIRRPQKHHVLMSSCARGILICVVDGSPGRYPDAVSCDQQQPLSVIVLLLSRQTKPLTFADCIGDELPVGWEEAYDPAVGAYYVDHNTSE